jgi:hypothetical protein
MNIIELSEGDKIEINSHPLRGCPLRVCDVADADIGLTDVTACTLSDGEREYLLQGASHSEQADIVDLDADETLEPVAVEEIRKV